MKRRFHEFLCDLRTDSDLTQQQITGILGISASHYGHFEAGIREPSLSTLRGICELFHASSDHLLGLSTDESVEKLLRCSSPLPKVEKDKVFEYSELLYQKYYGKNKQSLHILRKTPDYCAGSNLEFFYAR